jgi:hypothetical protein
MRLIEFTGALHGRPVYVNPRQVAAITSGEDEQVMIWLAHIPYPVLVVGWADEVAAKLQEAVCE